MKVLAFAQARDLLGFSELTIDAAPDETPETILERVRPGSTQNLKHCRIALDLEYGDWHQPVKNAGELAVIPPVSGG